MLLYTFPTVKLKNFSHILKVSFLIFQHFGVKNDTNYLKNKEFQYNNMI